MSTEDLAKIPGIELPDRPVGWNKRDLLTYAVGVGAKNDDLHFVYELHSNFSAIPTYPVVLALKGADQDVNVFTERVGGGTRLPGVPKLDPNRVVHGTQSIEIIKPLPLVSGDGWKWKTRYTSVVENKSGLILTAENLLVDPQGVPYAKLYSSSFNVGAKVTGQRFSKTIAGPPPAKDIPKRQPDWTVKDATTPEQAVIFRLSGDYNALHIDPKIGQAAGFGGVILHGLSTFGFVARALIKAVGGNDPNSLKFYGVRFTSPVKPGDAIETQIWEVGSGPDVTTELAFVAKNLNSGKASLTGNAYIKKSEKSKL